jgi:F0F1-type ATP synthase gamma subunit
MTEADIVIVGHEGKKFYESTDVKRPFHYIELPDTNVTLEMLKPLIHFIIDYKKATIFYGKFTNIIQQEAAAGSLSGDLPESEVQKETAREDFLFEPTIEQVMEFFESQILSMLLNQTVSESKLARFASRIKAMEYAQNNIMKRLTVLSHRQRQFKSMETNKKQLQLFAGRSLWGKK